MNNDKIINQNTKKDQKKGGAYNRKVNSNANSNTN